MIRWTLLSLVSLFVTSVMGFIQIFDNYVPDWIAGIMAFYMSCTLFLVLIAAGEGIEE